jgi:K+-sensing histidine kinase KdpD
MNKQNQIPSRKQFGQAFIAAAAIFAATFFMLLIGRNILGEGAITLLYLLLIGWCTLRWGRIAGASAALTSALTFDYFFIQPFYTLNIESVEGWLVLLIFMLVSVFVVGRIQFTLAEGKNREREATFLYELITSIANLQTREEVARTIATRLQQQYLAEVVRVSVYTTGDLPLVMVYAPQEIDSAREKQPDMTLPLSSGSKLIGEISVWQGQILPLPTEDDHLLQSFVRQIALALNRVKIVENAHLGS